MKKASLLLTLLLSFYSNGQITTSPNPIEVDQQVTITVDINTSATDCNGMSNPNKVYMHSGVGDDSNPWGYSVVGNWGLDDGVGEMTDNGDGSWSITFIPETYYGLSSTEASSVTKMGIVFRSEDGSQELKDIGCSDFFLDVGALQLTMINPSDSGVILVDYNAQTQIVAQNTNGPADYELFVDGISYHTASNTTFYQSSFISNITENTYCSLVVSQGDSNVIRNFTIFVNNTENQDIASDLVQGINYHDNDNSKATLVLEAPFKDFVYVAGSFNDYQPDSEYAMKKDTNSDLFWIDIEGLSPGQIETYQYWVYDQSPASGSPKEVRTADPYSTLVLSPFDDPWIPENSYPNLPDYPTGQSREVTVLQTGQQEYNWQVNDFEKPAKEDLVIYEVLIRDFDSDRNYQDLIDKIEYFKNLNINAIELMPVMEFEGNESWGYNPSFHMALDKYYGTENKFKEFIDLCHSNGISVILDIALNHVFGRSPLVRMWMEDPDENGWGDPSTENPYFNYEATHSYGIGADFNHSNELTKNYTKRVIKHWIEEFKIDGFRWDLTKGFTQNCSSGDNSCTDSYQSDRIAILKEYADFSWSLDPDHYVIFEHLGNQQEQKEWADYRFNEGKGIMLWAKMNQPYNQLTMGYSSDSNISGMGHNSQNFNGLRLVGYAESHDEERLMYNNLEFGASNSNYDITDLNTALARMPALGAVSLTVPGPKMIWHFGELGMQNSLFTCSDGSVGSSDDCKLDTKPQPQWEENWLNDPVRSDIYNTWSRLIELKINEPVFKGNYDINSGSLKPTIYIWNDDLPENELKNVIILSNFELSDQNVIPYFPYSGMWYDLMDSSGNTFIDVVNTTDVINIPAGEFRIFGNAPAQSLTLNNNEFSKINMYPNPANDVISFNKDLKSIKIYDLTGKVVFENNLIYYRGSLLNISNISNGIFIVGIKGMNDKSQYIKLLKN